jgi:serine/threonine-protein phosphatase 2A regulatory subunit A
MESLKNIAKILNSNDNKTHTLPIIIQGGEDKSWRVRLNLAKIFAELAEAVGKEISDSSLIQIFSNLLKDNESDVKVVAV